MTSPHDLLESMQQAAKDHGGKAGLGQQVDMSVWPSAVDALRKAVHFDVGSARPTEAHEDFAYELFEHAMFRMPFPVTLWTGYQKSDDQRSNAAILVSEDDPEVWRATGEHAGGTRGIGMLLFGTMFDNKSGRSWIIPLASGRVSYTSVLAADGPVRITWRALTRDAVRGGARNGSSEPGVAGWKEDNFASTIDKALQLTFASAIEKLTLASAIDKAMRLTLGTTVMLMTPDVEQRVVPAPGKLNVARGKRGKPPIGERRCIVVKPHAAAALSSEASRACFDGRKSPDPHLRRGHFRTLRRGSDGQMVIPIAPCVVGVSEDARSIMAKRYTIKA